MLKCRDLNGINAEDCEKFLQEALRLRLLVMRRFPAFRKRRRIFTDFIP
jgi:hypothetical protein